MTWGHATPARNGSNRVRTQSVDPPILFPASFALNASSYSFKVSMLS